MFSKEARSEETTFFRAGDSPGGGAVRRLLILLLGLACCLPAAADVTVTGKVTSVGTAGIAKNLVVRFELRNHGNNICRILGTSVIVQTTYDFRPDSNGNISGTLYGNDQIDCGGVSFTRYAVIYLLNNSPIPPTLEYLVQQPTFNLNSASPTTVTSPALYSPVMVVKNPQADQDVAQPLGTFFRVTGGKVDFTSAAGTAPIKTGLLSAIPASCLANKELYIPTDVQELDLCNGAGNGFIAISGGLPGVKIVDGVHYATIAAAVAAAGTTGAVLIPPTYAGTDTDPNANKRQIIDLRGFPNRQRGYINVLTDCGLKGTGLDVDMTTESTAAQACLNAYPSWLFWFPPTKTDGSCSYKFNATLSPTGEGTTLTGGSSGFKNSNTQQGGTVLCWTAGVTGIELDLTGANCSGCSLRDMSLMGSEGTNHLVTPTLLNIPSGANLPLFTRLNSSIQRTANVLTVTVLPANGAGSEALVQQVGSTVKITNVAGDTTMNGLCVIATLNAPASNPTTYTCPQNGADSGPFVSDGKTMLPTTGASSADGVRLCTNFARIVNLVITKFGRHGINADSSSADGLCPTPFSDDLILKDTTLMDNQADGYLCYGADCNAHVLSGNFVYYNLLWGIHDESSLGNTHIGNQLSNGGHLWASSNQPATKAISSISRTLTNNSSTVSVVLSVADTTMKLGSCVVIAGVTDASFNSTAGQCFFITSFTDSTHYSYIQPGAPVDASSSGGTSRMAKFSEAYLSSGVDDGASKIDTQSGFSPTVINQYVEGGQGCKWGPNVILIGGANTPVCALPEWRGRYLTTQGVTGFGGNLSMNVGLLLSDADSNYIISLRSGNVTAATARDIIFQWKKYDNTVGWQIDGGTSGTNGDTSSWVFQRSGAVRRLGFWGINNSSGITRMNSEGSGGIGFNIDGGSGTGGSLFGDGAGNTTATISAAGLGTFNGGVIGPFFKSNTTNPASAGQVRLAKTDVVNFRNNANSGDVTALSLDGSDNVVLPTVASLTSAAGVTAASVTIGGDSAMSSQPRIAWNCFLPGNTTSTWTACQFTPKKAINVVQVELSAKTAPVTCTPNAVVRVTDGSSNQDTTLTAAQVTNNIAGGQNYAANAVVQVKVTTAAAGCGTSPADVNVTVQYKMQ